MKKKALTAARLFLSLLMLTAGSGSSGGLGIIVDQIQAIGPRQWLNVATASLVSRAAAAAPDRIARHLPDFSFAQSKHRNII
jgi:hypothetical protein